MSVSMSDSSCAVNSFCWLGEKRSGSIPRKVRYYGHFPAQQLISLQAILENRICAIREALAGLSEYEQRTPKPYTFSHKGKGLCV